MKIERLGGIDRIKEKFKIIRYKGDNNEMNKNLSFKLFFPFNFFAYHLDFHYYFFSFLSGLLRQLAQFGCKVESFLDVSTCKHGH